MVVFQDEWDYLIHLLRCAIHGKQPMELPEELDFYRVYEYGKFHHVENIAFESVEKLSRKPEDALYTKWKDRRDKAVVRSITQNFAAQEIRDAFVSGDVRWLEVQGTKIKHLYPRPEWRTMSDIDFIIDFENLTRAGEILESLGYQWRIAHEGTEVAAHRPPNINIELHTTYFPPSSDYHSVMEPPFASPGEENYYVYNILHIAKHYYYGGCGIRRVMDAYFLNRYCRCKNAQSHLDRANASEFAANLSALAENWFGEKGTDSPRTEMADYILHSGLHGHKGNELDNLVRRSMDAGRCAKGKYLLGRILGSKEIPYINYPILEQYKILYPFCWLHRVFGALFKIKRLKREVHAVMHTDK